jgi:carboxyl-terminal processing protease
VKKLIFLLALAATVTLKAQMPDSVKLVLDSSITLLQQYSLHKKIVNWDALRKVTFQKAAKAKTWNDLGPAATYMFEAVNDHHGWLSVGDSDFRWTAKATLKFSEAVKNEIAKGNRIVKRMLPGNIGYLRVPGMMLDTSMYNKKAQQLADSLCALQQMGADKYIIDLRLNAGGTVFPMIAGISALLGNGKFVGNARADGKIENMSVLEEGKFYSYDGGNAKAVINCKQINFKTPVVILTSNLTGSAGEGVAVAFKGRKNTRFIGEPTAGFTTANNGHWIIEGKAGIVIAEAVLVDRSGKIYSIDVRPDEVIWGGDNFDDYMQDKKILAALKWLRKAKTFIKNDIAQ